MMKKIINLILILCSTAVVFNSCTLFDVVDELPPNAMVSENVIYDEKSADNVMIGCYGEFRKWGYNDALLWAPACQAGLFKEGVRDNLPFAGEHSYMANEIEAATSQSAYSWESFYVTINRVNNLEQILSTVEDHVVSKESKEKLLGEARFLRAHAYINVLKFFGYFWDVNSEYGVILRKEPATTKNIPYKRSTVRETYDFINQDLDYAMVHAPKFVKANNHRGTALAAKALKARVLLYTGKYLEAAKLADEVINNKEGVALEAKYETVFTSNLASSELIFGRKLDPEAMRYDNQKWTFKNAGLVLSDLAIDLLKTDARYAAQAEAANLEDYYTGEMTYYGMRIKKGWNEESTYGSVFSRLSEMYLIKAEGLIKGNGNMQDALDALNVLHLRGGNTEPLTMQSPELLAEITFKEIIKELCFEDGHEWAAMVRFKKVATYKPGVTDEGRWVSAIPSSEISYNYLCIQNPYHVR